MRVAITHHAVQRYVERGGIGGIVELRDQVRDSSVFGITSCDGTFGYLKLPCGLIAAFVIENQTKIITTVLLRSYVVKALQDLARSNSVRKKEDRIGRGRTSKKFARASRIATGRMKDAKNAKGMKDVNGDLRKLAEDAECE